MFISKIRIDDLACIAYPVSFFIIAKSHRALIVINYLLVVTSRDLYLGRGDVLDAMCQPNGIEYPSELAKRLLPLTHVFYVSIDAYELIVAAVKAKVCQLPELLARAVERNRNPVTASYWLELQIPVEARGIVDEGSLVTKAWEASIERLARALGAKPTAVDITYIMGAGDTR